MCPAILTAATAFGLAALIDHAEPRLGLVPTLSDFERVAEGMTRRQVRVVAGRPNYEPAPPPGQAFDEWIARDGYLIVRYDPVGTAESVLVLRTPTRTGRVSRLLRIAGLAE